MAISRLVRDQLLVEARHRCTICLEKCFELHHIVEQADGGSDDADNLIVLCPNCHQHRYHRHGEFTRDQLLLYKQKLRGKSEIELRVIRNLEDIKRALPDISVEEAEKRLRKELQEASSVVSQETSPGVSASVQKASEWLAERDLIRGGARRAIEIEWEVRRQQQKQLYPEINLSHIDNSTPKKAPDFPRAYYYVLVLNRVPHSDWAQVFESLYKRSFYMQKRPASIRRDRITLTIADTDDLQGHADHVKRVVKETNDKVRGYGFELIDRKIDQGKRESLAQFDAIQSMQARFRGVKL